MTEAPSRPHVATTSYPAAELDRRFYAYAVDRLVVWGLYAVAGWVLWTVWADDGRWGPALGAGAAVVLVLGLAFAVLVGVAGVTPGKAALSLRVVRRDDGRPIGVGAGLLRTLVLGLAAVPTLGIGLATLAWTALIDPSGRRRGVHDRFGEAVVVDVRPVEADDEPEEDERPWYVGRSAGR